MYKFIHLVESQFSSTPIFFLAFYFFFKILCAFLYRIRAWAFVNGVKHWNYFTFFLSVRAFSNGRSSQSIFFYIMVNLLVRSSLLNLWLKIITQPGLEQWEWLWMPKVNLVLLMALSLLQWQSHHSRNKPSQSAIQRSHHGSWILFHLISQLVSFIEIQLLQCEMHLRIAFYKPMDQEFLNFRSKSRL